MIQAGFDVIWSQELNTVFANAHDFGMDQHFSADSLPGKAPTITSRQDIREIGPAAVRKQGLGTLMRGDHFGIIGGPPCPDFSIGGKNRGGEGDRGRLTQVFVERICGLQPMFFLIENVKGLISTRKHREFIYNGIWKLDESGYAVDLTVLNALDFGVPQDRERVFIVGVKRSLVRSLYSRNLEKGQDSAWPFAQMVRDTWQKLSLESKRRQLIPLARCGDSAEENSSSHRK